MTRKDYQLIAETINNTFSEATFPTERDEHLKDDMKSILVGRFADVLRTTNPRFDGQRFIDACNK